MSSLGGVGAYSPQMSGYAPADFLDAEETRPSEIYLDPTGTGTATPYSTAVGNALNRTLEEVRQANPHPSLIQENWKRKYREFLTNKNEDLLGFLTKKIGDHPTTTRTQTFFRKYGKAELRETGGKEKFLDLSGATPYQEQLDQELKQIGKSSYTELIQQVKYLMEQYRQTGEKLLQLDGALRAKLDAFDKCVHKVSGFGEIRQSHAFSVLMSAVQEYLSQVFEENKIEDLYQEYVQCYKKFQFLRESIQFIWLIESSQRESLCSICFNDPIQFALVPCGHTFCSSCVKRQMMSCCICRTNVREKVKLFIG